MTVVDIAGLPANVSRKRKPDGRIARRGHGLDLLFEDAADPDQSANRHVARRLHALRWWTGNAGSAAAVLVPLAPLLNVKAAQVATKFASDTAIGFHLYVGSQAYAMATAEAAFAVALVFYIVFKGIRWNLERDNLPNRGSNAAGDSLLALIQMLRNADYIGWIASLFGLFMMSAALLKCSDTAFPDYPALAEFFAAMTIARLGYVIGRSYMPGSVIVQEYMILGEMSASSIGYSQATENIRAATWRQSAKRPHCFYYRKRQKSKTKFLD